MSQYVLGDTVVLPWTVLNTADAPLTGVTTPAGIVFVLRRQSGVLMIAASETITWTEQGVTGHYSISFTPTSTGIYSLQLHELHASSLGRWFTYPEIEILTAGATFTASYSNAFCSEADIERWTQTAISATSAPSDNDAAAFAEARAAILMSLCAKYGFSVTPATVTAGSRIEDLLREANAIGAALDYTLTQQQGLSPNVSEKVERLDTIWGQYTSTVEREGLGYIPLEIKGNLASLATNHILSGDTLAAPVGAAPTDSGVGPTTMGSIY